MRYCRGIQLRASGQGAPACQRDSVRLVPVDSVNHRNQTLTACSPSPADSSAASRHTTRSRAALQCSQRTTSRLGDRRSVETSVQQLSDISKGRMEGRSAASPHRSSYSSPLDSQDCGWGLQDFSDFNSVDVMSPASFRGQGFSYGGWPSAY